MRECLLDRCYWYLAGLDTGRETLVLAGLTPSLSSIGAATYSNYVLRPYVNGKHLMSRHLGMIRFKGLTGSCDPELGRKAMSELIKQLPRI